MEHHLAFRRSNRGQYQGQEAPRRVFAQRAGDLYNKTTGDTAGVMQWVATSSSTSEPLISAAGCAFTTSSYPGTNGTAEGQYARRDLA